LVTVLNYNYSQLNDVLKCSPFQRQQQLVCVPDETRFMDWINALLFFNTKFIKFLANHSLPPLHKSRLPSGVPLATMVTPGAAAHHYTSDFFTLTLFHSLYTLYFLLFLSFSLFHFLYTLSLSFSLHIISFTLYFILSFILSVILVTNYLFHSLYTLYFSLLNCLFQSLYSFSLSSSYILLLVHTFFVFFTFSKWSLCLLLCFSFHFSLTSFFLSISLYPFVTGASGNLM